MNTQDMNRIIYLDEGWAKIKVNAIDLLESMLDNGFQTKMRLFDSRQYALIYKTCYDMCTQFPPHNYSGELYSRHGEAISSYLSNTVVPALRNKYGEFLLKEFVRRWNNHKIMNEWMRRFFIYLDRYHVEHNHLQSLSDVGLTHFKSIVYDSVKGEVTKAMISVINAEREGEIIDRSLISTCVQTFVSMDKTLEAYKSDFEEPLLKATRNFYHFKSQNWIGKESTPDYLIRAEKYLEEEVCRVESYLHSSTEPELLRCCEHQFLGVHKSTLLEREGSGFRALLANNKLADISRLYSLFSRLPSGILPMASLFSEYIIKEGNDALERRQERVEGEEKESNQDTTVIKDMIRLHDRFTNILINQFASNALMQKAMKEAFMELVNKDIGKVSSAELMTNFCDRILRSGGEMLSDGEVEEYLERIVRLFAYLTEKDMFAELYRQQLAKRLLNQRSASDDSERLMILKLKCEWGSQFTSKMEGMMNDLAIGRDHAAEFDKYFATKGMDIDFNVQVLTTGNWPTYKLLSMNLPPQLEKCIDIFKEYYDNKYSKRKLTWIHSLGTVSVRATYANGKIYEFLLSTLQACALTKFAEQRKVLGVSDVTELLNIPDEATKRVLHSLSCGKFKILTRIDGAGPTIKQSDFFQINEEFSCPMRKIRVPMATLEVTRNSKRIEEDRSITIEATIVRIMKARKVMSHQQLVAEVLSQLHFFRPNPKVIKKRIEALIEREYLERDEESPNTYRYLA